MKPLCACLAQIIVIREHLASSFCRLLNISVNIIPAVSLTPRQHMPGHAAFTPNSSVERGNTRSKYSRRISGRPCVLVAMDTVSGVLGSLHQALVASGSVCVLMCVMHWCESVAKDRQRPFSLLSSTTAFPVLTPPPPSSHLPLSQQSGGRTTGGHARPACLSPAVPLSGCDLCTREAATDGIRKRRDRDREEESEGETGVGKVTKTNTPSHAADLFDRVYLMAQIFHKMNGI